MVKESPTLLQLKCNCDIWWHRCHVTMVKTSPTPLQLSRHFCKPFHSRVTMMKESPTLLQPANPPPPKFLPGGHNDEDISYPVATRPLEL